MNSQLNTAKFVLILSVIKRAWEEFNPRLLNDILAEDIIYHEDPNEKPLNSVAQVIKRWEKDLHTHSNVTLNYEVMDIVDTSCIAKWSAEWDDKKRGHRQSKGVYYLNVNRKGKLQEFRQWWL